MDTIEFSNEFDVLLSSFTIGNSIVLDEYEKSVFLTQSQEQIVIELYNGRYSGLGFEKEEEIRRYLSNIVKTYETNKQLDELIGLSKYSVFYQLPKDCWYKTYEAVILKQDDNSCINQKNILVTPVTQDEFHRIMSNPYRGPSANRALRLDVNNNIVEIVSIYPIDRYLVRYLAQPSPIVLQDFTGVSVNDVSTKTECELDESLHRAILDRAVRLAITAKAQYVTNK